MSMVGFNLTEVPDVKLVGKSEQLLKCVSAKEKEGKDSGRKMIALAIQMVNEPTADTIFHNLCFPMEGDEPSTKIMFARQLKATVEAFGVEYTAAGFNLEDFKDKTTWGNVDVDTDPVYGTKNVIKGWTRRA